jgi:hypothetical protein
MQAKKTDESICDFCGDKHKTESMFSFPCKDFYIPLAQAFSRGEFVACYDCAAFVFVNDADGLKTHCISKHIAMTPTQPAEVTAMAVREIQKLFWENKIEQ